jgi:hypothetical protein
MHTRKYQAMTHDNHNMQLAKENHRFSNNVKTIKIIIIANVVRNHPHQYI